MPFSLKILSAISPKSIWLLGSIAFCETIFCETTNQPERPPNIVLIMADDVGWEAFGCYGGEDYQTPFLDDIARRGLRFEHCYSMPLCTPSRVKLMTGQYNFRNYTHFGFLNPKEKTFAHLLQNAGYKTAIAGKWQLNGLPNSLAGFDDSTRPFQAGFHESLLWQVTKEKRAGERFWHPLLEHNGKRLSRKSTQGKYGPDLFVDFICDFIERHRQSPFFVYYPMVLVHDPFVPTPDTLDLPLTKMSNKTPKDPTKRKRNFASMVKYMDKLVGRIDAKIQSLGLAEETILLFTSDNGTNRSLTSRWRGRDIRGGKGTMKDSGTRVPLIAYWKDHTPVGGVVSDLIDFTDFYASFMEAAQVKPHWKDPIDGRSFFPQLKGKPGNPRQWLFMHYQSYWGQMPGQFARTKQYKLYRNGEFYDVEKDLHEANPLVDDLTPNALSTKRLLQNILSIAPPAHTEKSNRSATLRPTYPTWNALNL